METSLSHVESQEFRNAAPLKGSNHEVQETNAKNGQIVSGAHLSSDMGEVALLKKELMKEFTREAHQFYRDKSLTRKHIAQALACLTILVSVGVYISPKTKAESAVFYPESCLGGWVNATHATGIPETESNEFPRAFNANNSALLEAGTGADIYCGNFKGEFDKNTKPTKIIVSLSWSKAEVVSTTTEVVSDSFASSSLEILDASSSNSVSFTLATTTEEVSSSTLDSTTGAYFMQSSSTTASTTSPSEGVHDASTSQQVLPDTSTSTGATEEKSTLPAQMINSNIPQDSTTSEVAPLHSETPQEIPQAVPVSELPPPPTSEPTHESPLSFVRRISSIVAMSFGASVYADEVPVADAAPSVNAEVQAPSSEVPVLLPVPALDTAKDGQQIVAPPLSGQDVNAEASSGVSLLSIATSTEAIASTSPLAPIDTAPSSTSSAGFLGGVQTALDAVQQVITDSVQLPVLSSSTMSVATSTLFDGVIPSILEKGIDLGISTSSPVFSSKEVLIDDQDVAFVYASSSLSQSVQVETNSEDDSQSNFLQITYTYDGVTWMNLARVNEDSIKYRTFEIPVTSTTSWADLSSLQIKVTPIPRIEQTPSVYLDAMKVEVLYETPGEPRVHPDFARDAIIKDKSDDNVRVVNIINSDTNNREIWYTTIRGQGEFGVAPGSWVKIDLGADVSSYRLVEIYGRYLFWIDESAKMFWTTNLERGSNEGTQINAESTTTIPFIKNNDENWMLEYNYKKRKGIIHITE
jgi:hypothetical protein